MEIGYAAIGSEGGHAAGRTLLRQMYEARFGRELPEILVADRGKPYLADSCVHFSISHTKRTVFCVLSDCPVGIDAEEEDRDIRLDLAEKILSATEKARFDRAENKRQFLLRLWVLKEAAAKCRGTGLTGYPCGTDFSPDDNRIHMINGCFVAVIKECK